MLRFALPLGSLRVIFETQQSLRIAYVHVVVVKSDAIWPVQPAYKHFIFLRAAGMLWVAQHNDLACRRIRKEYVAIGR